MKFDYILILIFSSKNSLIFHQRSHTNCKPFVCEWPGCESRFRDNPSLKKHKLVHKEIGEIICYWPQCGKRFKMKSNFKINILFVFLIFNLSYDLTKASLNIHLRAHKGEKPYKCMGIGCDMRFTHKGALRKHFGRKHAPKGEIMS